MPAPLGGRTDLYGISYVHISIQLFTSLMWFWRCIVVNTWK